MRGKASTDIYKKYKAKNKQNKAIQINYKVLEYLHENEKWLCYCDGKHVCRRCKREENDYYKNDDDY